MDFDLELYQGNKSTQPTGVEQSPSKVCKVEVDSYFTPDWHESHFLLLICLKSARDLCDKVQLKEEGSKQSLADVLAYCVPRRHHEGMVHIQRAGRPPDFRTRVHFNQFTIVYFSQRGSRV